MTHGWLQCLWRRGLRSYFIGGAVLCGNDPEKKKLTPEMIRPMIYYIYEPYNLEDFRDWIQSPIRVPVSGPQIGREQWREYFGTDQGELVCAPVPGPVLQALIVVFPILLGSVICSAALTGLYVWIGYIF